MGKLFRRFLGRLFLSRTKVEEPRITFKPQGSPFSVLQVQESSAATLKSPSSLQRTETSVSTKRDPSLGSETEEVSIKSSVRSFAIESPVFADEDFFLKEGRRLSLSLESSIVQGNFEKSGNTISSFHQIPSYEIAFFELVQDDEQQEELLESFQEIRSSQYGHLEDFGRTICDYVGLGLYSFSQLSGDAVPSPKIPPLNRIPCLDFQRLMKEWILEAFPQEKAFCQNIYRMLQVSEEEYDLFLTSTGGAAIRLLGNSFHFSPQSTLLTAYDCFDENVEQVKLRASRSKSRVEDCPIKWPTLDLDRAAFLRTLRSLHSYKEDFGVKSRNSGLFVYPAESRLSGSLNSLNLVKEAQQSGWKVLLDATGMSCGQELIFSQCRPEYAAFSFYKVFGYDPTGFGCLLVRRDPPPACPAHVEASDSLPTSREHSFTYSSSSSSRESREFFSTKDRGGYRKSESSSCASTPRRNFLTLPARLAEKYSGKGPGSTIAGPTSRRHRRSISEIFSGSSVILEVEKSSNVESSLLLVPREQRRRHSVELPRGPPPETEPEPELSDISGRELSRFGLDGSRSPGLAPRQQREDPWVGGAQLQKSPLSEIDLVADLCGGEERREREVLFLGEFYSVQRLGSPAIKVHLELLLNWLMASLKRLRHPGMQHISVVEVYGASQAQQRGTKIAFNIIDCRWETVPPSLVQMLADRGNLSLSVGKLAKHLSPPSSQALVYRRRFSSKWKYVECVGASFGLASNFEDVYRLFIFVAKFVDPEYVYNEQKKFRTDFHNQ